MLARDVNSNPTQYRTWIVPNEPDFTGQFNTGYKSGENAFVDVRAYAIHDDSVIADFNLPMPSRWNPDPGDFIVDFPARKVLLAPSDDSHFAIIDGYAYMFGGKFTDKIYKSTLNNPADWSDTGATLPTPLFGSALAIVDGYIYLFGGNDGYDGYAGALGTIYSAPTSNPLNWTNHGALLPRKLCYSNLGMYNGSLYLFGGQETNNASDAILTASTSNPLVWTDTGFKIPTPTYGSVFAQIDGYWWIYGGLTSPSNPTKNIFRAPVINPTFWQFDGYLPYATAFSQFITVGNDGYMIGPMVGDNNANGFTSILQCHLSTPGSFLDTNQIVRGVISHSQIAMIYDRVWLFGGSGETAIFACNQNLKYNFYDPTVQAYGQITRVLLPLTDNLNNPYQALCIPYWKTDYSF